jgi:hypothetical protein
MASGRRLYITPRRVHVTSGHSKLSAPDRHIIKVTDLRTETREFLENAHFRGWHYVVLRAGQPMIAILDHDEY